MSTRTLAIMFTDIKGFTARTSEENREELNRLLDEHDRLLRPAFARFGGTVVKTIGDAFLVWFASPTDAVVCGVVIQEILRKHNAQPGMEPLHVRVAINVGDVEIRKTANGTDLFGEAVNLASRLEGIAEAGEVWFTEAVYLTMNRHEVPSTEIGERTFKGIPTPVRVFKVIDDPKSDQLQRIAAGVRVEAGAPVFGDSAPRGSLTSAHPAAPPAETEAKPAPPRPAGRALRMALVALTLLAVVPAAWIEMSARRDRAVATRAEERLAKKDAPGALDLVDERLRSRPHNAMLIAIGTRAASEIVDAKAKEDPKAALTWAQQQIAAKPWLSGLSSRLPLLETEVALEAADGNGGVEQIVYDQMQKYPKDPDIPWAGAVALVRAGVMTASVSPLIETALENGHPADDDALTVCLEFAFHEFDPDARWSESCHRLLPKWYDERSVKWAREKLEDGNSYEMLNAFQILETHHDPAASDPFWLAVRELMMGNGDGAAVVAEPDPARRERARFLLDNRIHWGGTMDDARIHRMESVIAQLEKTR